MNTHPRHTMPRLMTGVLVVALLGCGVGEKNNAATPAPASSPAASSEVAESGQVTAFGVAECDAYVAKYTACVEANVTGEEKQRLLAGFEANRAKWRALATMREGAVALGLACRAAAQKAKEDLSVEYGCAF